MSTHSIPIAMLAAVTAYVGLYHFWLHLRRANRADLYFAATCLAMTGFDGFSVALYNAQSLEAAEPWHRLQLASILAVGPFFVSFVNAYTKVEPPRFVRRAVWIVFPLGALLVLFDRSGLALTHEPSIKHLDTRLFGEIVYYETELGPLLSFFQLTLPALAGYVVWATRKSSPNARARGAPQKRKDEPGTAETSERHTLPLLVGAGLLLAGLAHDTFISLGWLQSIYLTEYSFVGIMLLMSWSLSDEVVEAAVTRQALRETETRIATTLHAISDAVVTTDLEDRVTHLNRAAEKMLAVPLVEARGRPLTELLELTAPETLTRVPDPIRYAIGRPSNPYGRLPRLVTLDGSDRRVDLGGAPLVDASGRVQGAVVVLRDLTVQHNAIESLQHAKQMESMGQLAGGIAHDLNNLLTPILSYVELVQRQSDLTSRTAVFLNHVQEAAQRAAGLTRQLLALSRKQVLDVQALSLNRFVEQMLPILRRLVPEGIEVALDLDPRDGTVQVDPGQLEQVLLNLVSNARDAMPSGGRVVLSTQRLTETEVCLGVTDHGDGIPPALQERIFEPFFTTKPRGKGTGLGLASVRGIVEQHGGSIHVDSELGAGSTFDIVLPIHSGEAAVQSSRRSVAEDAARGSEHVLVVEDDPAVRTLVHDALTQLGYRVSTADGLTTALAIASSESIDLLLTDVVMPGADGPRVLEAVRRHRPGIPCLYVTGHADDRLGDRGILARGTEVLHKPFTVAELAKKVRDVLGRAQARTRPASSRE